MLLNVKFQELNDFFLNLILRKAKVRQTRTRRTITTSAQTPSPKVGKDFITFTVLFPYQEISLLPTLIKLL